MFSSYSESPLNMHFEGQDQDEKIILVLRAHQITNLKWIIPAIILFFLPFFLPFVVDLLKLSLPPLNQSYLLILLVINYLLVLVVSFEGFLYWYFNVYILTDKRIVDIDFHSLLFRNMDLIFLTTIQETQSESKGILSAIFDYGNVFIQTAGARVSADFHDVPRPQRVADLIMDEAHKAQG